MRPRPACYLDTSARRSCSPDAGRCVLPAKLAAASTHAALPLGIPMKCYLCDSKDLQKIRDSVRGQKINVWLCNDCGLDFLEPPGRDLRGFYAGEYRKQYSPSVESAYDSKAIFDHYRPFMDERVERLQSCLPDNGRVLEVGCSAGHFLHAIAPRVGEIVGIELNLDNCRFVSEELGFRTYSTPIEETDLEEDSFDTIFVFHTLEHMENPRGFLEVIRRYLKPDGKLYVEIPCLEDPLLSVYKLSSYADFWYREPHLFNFTAETLSLLTQQAGFLGEIVRVQRYSFLNHLSWKLTGKPQGSAEIAMRVPRLADPDQTNPEVAARLNAWFADVDASYRSLLQELGRTESIGFVGTRS